MDAYKIKAILEIADEEFERTINMANCITFNKLHEIICILFNLKATNTYKFIFADLKLTIKDTGTLNRDNIDSRYEIIDKYFQATENLIYQNNNWIIKLKISKTNYDRNFPEIIDIKGKFNPSNRITDFPEFNRLIKLKEHNIELNDKSLITEVKLMDIQEKLLILFNICYTIEKGKIILLKKEGTLNNYILS